MTEMTTSTRLKEGFLVYRPFIVGVLAIVIACVSPIAPDDGPCAEAMAHTIRNQGNPDEVRRDDRADHAGIPAAFFVEYIYTLEGGRYQSRLFAWGRKIGDGCATRLATFSS